MAGTDDATGAEALARAKEEDRLAWSTEAGVDTGRHRRDRDAAVLVAVRSGISPDQLADELGVLISDVQRMAAAAQSRVELGG